MKHTPYGYDIVGGTAVINEEQAAAIRQTCENYLSGMSMTQAALTAGIIAAVIVKGEESFKFNKSDTESTLKQKFKWFFSSVPVVIFVILCLWQSIKFFKVV